MKKKALIIYGGWEGHDPKETARLFARDLEGAGVGVDFSSELSVLTDEPRMAGFDLIVPHWTMGELKPDEEKGLLRAVQAGAGLAGLHGGLGDAFRASTGFQFAVGGQFVAHPDNHKDYVVHIVAKNDPITAGLVDFKVHSEQYYLHVDPSNEVLATTTFETKSAPWVNGTVMPVAWKRKYGEGRVFYHSIGHGLRELQVPEVRELTRRGLLWAMR